jgi:hypothetical protein
MKDIAVDPIWVAGTLFSAMAIGFGWYIVRLDHLVESLREEIIKMEKEIGALQNADVTCTRDQDILKMDMSHIRATMLKMVARRFMRRSLREDWKAAKKAKKKLKGSQLVQHGDVE